MSLQLEHPGQTWRQELVADLVAAGAPEHTDWVHEPAILRRVAAVLGRSIPAEADAIVAIGERGDILATAVSLATGLPVLDLSRQVGPSPLAVSVMAITPSELADLDGWNVCSRLHLFGEPSDGRWTDVLGLSARKTDKDPSKGHEMSESDVAEAVAAVTAEDGTHTRIDLGIDPVAADTIAAYLAGQFAELGVTAVASWEDAEDVVLGHLVAAKLGLQRYFIMEEEGLLTVTREIPPGSTVGWVATRTKPRRPKEYAAAFIEGKDSQLVAFSVMGAVEKL